MPRSTLSAVSYGFVGGTHLNSARARGLIRHIAGGEENETIAILDPGVRDDLPWSVISQVWTEILTDLGELQEITGQTVVPIKGNPDTDSVYTLTANNIGTAVVASTLRHEAGELTSRIAISRDCTVVGVLFLPTDVTDYQF